MCKPFGLGLEAVGNVLASKIADIFESAVFIGHNCQNPFPEDAPTSDGKILFKQPKKRSSDATEHERMKTAVPDKVKKTKVEKKQPSRSLLSFDDEEEDS